MLGRDRGVCGPLAQPPSSGPLSSRPPPPPRVCRRPQLSPFLVTPRFLSESSWASSRLRDQRGAMAWLNVRQCTRTTNVPFTVALGCPGNPSSSLHSHNNPVSSSLRLPAVRPSPASLLRVTTGVSLFPSLSPIAPLPSGAGGIRRNRKTSTPPVPFSPTPCLRLIAPALPCWITVRAQDVCSRPCYTDSFVERFRITKLSIQTACSSTKATPFGDIGTWAVSARAVGSRCRAQRILPRARGCATRAALHMRWHFH